MRNENHSCKLRIMWGVQTMGQLFKMQLQRIENNTYDELDWIGPFVQQFLRLDQLILKYHEFEKTTDVLVKVYQAFRDRIFEVPFCLIW